MLRDDLFPFQFLKKSRFSGSYQGMRYRLEKTEDGLTAWVFPGPYAFDYTDEELKESHTWPFTPKGYEEAKDWLEKQAESRSWMAYDTP